MGKKRKVRTGRANGATAAGVTATLDRWLALAGTAASRGEHAEARTYFRKFVSKEPSRAPVWHALAGACYQLGEAREAATALERACAIDTDNVEYLNDLGGVYLALDDLTAAERTLRAVVALEPAYGQAQYNLASVLYQSGKVSAAIVELDRLLQREPAFAEAQFNLGIALRDIGNLAGALTAFRTAKKLQSDNARTHLELARLEAEAHVATAAIGHYRDYLARCPGDGEVLAELAELLHRDGQTDAAIELLERGRGEQPELALLPLTLAGILHNAGRLDAAEAMYLAVLRDFPQATSAAVGLSRLRRFSDVDDPVLETLIKGLDDPAATPEQQEPVHFALGKIHDDLGDYERAFHHYAAGNATHARSTNYDRAAAELQTDALIDVYSASALAAGAAHVSASEKPVLIVGMPRAGTTLTEQIIAAHDAAAGAGELAYFSALATQLPQMTGSQAIYPRCWPDVDEKLAANIVSQYLALLERHGPDALRVTDKMPVNYKHVGFFASLFPRARVICCRRDPRDVALSIFFQYFRERHDYAWAMPDIAHCYVQHERLLRHWAASIPRGIHEVVYSDLIGEHEHTARKLIESLGLQWDPNCLDFHKVERDVKTASNWQVRQPVYSTSLDRWRRYEAFLGDFDATLQSERSRYGLPADD